MAKARILSIADEAVQEFLWAHLVPTDIEASFTKADAFNYVVQELVAGRRRIVGDIERDVALLCQYWNPQVVLINVMGTAMHFPDVFPECLDLAWENGITKIMSWSHHPSLGRICQRFGFVKEGHLKRMHMDRSGMHDLEVYSLERPHQ